MLSQACLGGRMADCGRGGRAAALGTLSVTVLAVLGMALSAAAQAVQWRPGISAAELGSARVVRTPAGVRANDLRMLRDDQVLETPSGRHIQVGRFRQIQRAFEIARLRSAQPRPQAFRILAPTPRIAPVPLRPHETAAELLARPPDQVVRLPDGHTATVAQLRAIAPYVQQRYHVNVYGAPTARLAPVGPATRITSLAQLKALPRNLPDSTILQSPSGARVTLGEVRQVLKARPKPTRSVTPVRTRQ